MKSDSNQTVTYHPLTPDTRERHNRRVTKRPYETLEFRLVKFLSLR